MIVTILYLCIRSYEETHTIYSILDNVKANLNTIKGLKKGSIIEGIALQALDRKIL
jgi:hypothetical protein